MKSTNAHSLRELADGVGRAHQVVARWVERPDWNQSRRPPWDIAKARTWAAATLGPNPADTWKRPEIAEPASEADGIEGLRKHPLQAARLKLMMTRAAKLELERAILAGEVVPRQQVEEGFVRRVLAVRSAFEALPRQLAGRLVGLTDEAQVEHVLDDAIRAVLLEMSQRPALPPLRNLETENG